MDGTSGDSISTSVVEEVAAREAVDTPDLDTPLYAVIDPDALDAVFASGEDKSSSVCTVEFTYYGYRIVIHNDGRIDVNEQNQ